MPIQAHIADRLAAFRNGVKQKASRPHYSWPYPVGEAVARPIKALLQMAIGISLTAMLLWKILFPLPSASHYPAINAALQLNVLTLVGKGLEYSAGFELAYMLFTPGPDEALEPVILGLAAAVLIIISNESVDWSDAVVAPILCLAIGFLFYIKRRFVDRTDDEPS